MDPERERIQADLRGIVQGEVRCDDLFSQMYASDASIYEIKPLGVVRPRSVADVVAAVQYAAEHGISIHPRGAGSGLAGESLGRGLLFDMSHSMRRPIEFDVDSARVQAGLPLLQLNSLLAKQNRRFGPDPANRAVTTIGSVASLDGSGSHWPIYGSARKHISAIQVVLADGQVVELNREQTSTSPVVSNLSRRVNDLAKRHQKTIAEHRPKTLVNRCGYHLDDAAEKKPVDLVDVVVGSEGTLGVITELTVDTVPIPNHRGAVLLLFERIELAARAALELRRFQPWSCDLFDRRLMRLAAEVDFRFQLLLPEVTEASLLVEIQDDDPAEVRGRLQQIIQLIQRKRKLAFDAKLALDEEEVAFYMQLPSHVVPTLYRLKGQRRALPFVEDIAVPPKELPNFIATMQNVLKEHEVTASLFAHAGHGQLHLRPFLDLANLDHVHQLHQLAKDLYQEVMAVGGTISGEHGTGLSRTWFMQQQHGALQDVFRQVKYMFDPRGIMNPGKVVAKDAQPVTHNLRPVVAPEVPVDQEPAAQTPQIVQLNLDWNADEVLLAARTCNGCGGCHTLSPLERMCPIFRNEPKEESSPRAKANLMRALFAGSLEWDTVATDAMKDVADLCVNCHQCRIDCPARVDIPKLMTECKSQYVSKNGLRFSEWLLGRVDLLCAWGSRFATVANWINANPRMRWLVEKCTGISIGRKLPRFATRTYMRSPERRRLGKPNKLPGNKVAYFVDLYANHFDLDLATSLVAILEHHGIGVYIPSGQLSSGMPLIAQGNVERARQIAKRNVSLFADAIRQGYHVIATEPSAAMCLTQEYPSILDDAEANLVAENTSEACDYLWRLHLAGKLELDLKPINSSIAYHEPCHVRALHGSGAGEKLMRLVPGVTVQSIDRGCSGMAGIYGLRRENYIRSLRMGMAMINEVRSTSIQIGATECSACRMQMQQGTTKTTLHPLKLLAASYGLTPSPLVMKS